ncbi:MAG: hypothetical protein Q8O23_03255, partial [Gallionella sp.]|nr:hypothetical protein [Gallionella sp.]
GINVLLLFVVWNFMLRKTLLDHYRDKLFDLREEVRSFFLMNDIPLDSKEYKNLRDLLNAHLRFTERFTFLKFIILEVEIKNNKGLQEYLKIEIDKRFNTENPKLKDFVPQVREKAKVILLNHMVNSSGALWIFVITFSPVLIVWNFLHLVRHAVRTSFAALTDGFYYSINKAIKSIFTINTPIRTTVKKDLLEECSYRVGAKSAIASC